MSYDTTQSELESLFSEVGQVVEVFLPSDRDTGRPRGFAFVEFSNESAVAAAIEKFDGHQLKGRTLHVNEAEEKQQRRPSRFSDNRSPGMSPYQKKSKPKGSRRNIRAQKRGY